MSKLRRVGDGGNAAGAFGAFSGDGNGGLETGGGVLLPEGIEGEGAAEELAQKKEYREQFSLCVSRAVANLATLSEYCLPFIKKGGRLVSYKSGEVADELKNAEKAIKILGGERQQPIYFNLPGTDIQRSFIIIKKTETTPKKYPRKAGTPSKQPLGVEIIGKE